MSFSPGDTNSSMHYICKCWLQEGWTLNSTLTLAFNQPWDSSCPGLNQGEIWKQDFWMPLSSCTEPNSTLSVSEFSHLIRRAGGCLYHSKCINYVQNNHHYHKLGGFQPPRSISGPHLCPPSVAFRGHLIFFLTSSKQYVILLNGAC